LIGAAPFDRGAYNRKNYMTTINTEQAKLVASDVRGQVVVGAGHWLMEEAPQTVIPAILDFVNGVPS